MNVIHTLRTYLGLSQSKLAKQAGITQPDLSEMESKPPYGYPWKYQRLSKVLGVPVHALLKNDFTAIPESFFDNHPTPKYEPAPTKPDLLLGRQGEEFILRREKERLSKCWPALSKLVLPYYKMKGPSPGFDILSFDDQGTPILLEVKTSLYRSHSFYFTKHELDVAENLSSAGEQYFIVYISSWGTENQQVHDISYEELAQTHQVYPWQYICRPISKREPKTVISGLAHFRRMRCLRQTELAESLGINQYELSLYENGQRIPSVQFYLSASELLDVTVDELLAEYGVPRGVQRGDDLGRYGAVD